MMSVAQEEAKISTRPPNVVKRKAVPNTSDHRDSSEAQPRLHRETPDDFPPVAQPEISIDNRESTDAPQELPSGTDPPRRVEIAANEVPLRQIEDIDSLNPIPIDCPWCCLSSKTVPRGKFGDAQSMPRQCHCCEDLDYRCDECGHMLARRNYKFLLGDLEAKPSVVYRPRNEAERMRYVLPKAVVVKKKQIELEKEIVELRKTLSGMAKVQKHDVGDEEGVRVQGLDGTQSRRATVPVEVWDETIPISVEIGDRRRHEKEAATAGAELDASRIFEMGS